MDDAVPKLLWPSSRSILYIAGQYQAGQDAPDMTNTFWQMPPMLAHFVVTVFWLNSTRQCYMDCDLTTKHDGKRIVKEGNQRNQQVLNHSPPHMVGQHLTNLYPLKRPFKQSGCVTRPVAPGYSANARKVSQDLHMSPGPTAVAERIEDVATGMDFGSMNFGSAPKWDSFKHQNILKNIKQSEVYGSQGSLKYIHDSCDCVLYCQHIAEIGV